MSINTINKPLSIAPNGIPTVLRLPQNENGRDIIFDLSETVPAGSLVVLEGTKPDGAVYSLTGTITDNKAVFDEDTQMTAVAGDWDARVTVTYNSETVATGRIRMVIERDPVDPDAIASDSELRGLVAQCQAYAEGAKDGAYYGSPLTAATVAEMTDTDRVYVYTGTEAGYTAGNWYYYDGAAWTSGGVYNAVAVQTDTTLSVAGKAADGKATGDAIGALEDELIDSKTLDVSGATLLHFQVLANGKWSAVSSGNARGSVVPIPEGALRIDITASPNNSYFAFFDTYSGPVNGQTPDFSDNYNGRIVLNSGASGSYAVESDMHYLYMLRLNSSAADVTPTITYKAVKTDDTLTKADVAADAKATGDELDLTTRLKPFDGGTRLENQSPNTFCRVANVTIDDDDKPDGVDFQSYYGWLFTHKGSLNGIQILWYSHANVIYRRFYRNGGYSAWQGVGNAVKQEVNILVIGNSFDQDSYAYLPAVLSEAMPDLLFRVCVLYTGSATLANHVQWYNDSTKYSIFNIWNPGASKWSRRSNDNSYTLADTLAMYDWDVITTNYTSQDTISAPAIDSMVSDARDLLEILQANARKPFVFLFNQVMARQYNSISIDEMYENGLAAMEAVKAGVGIYDYIPIGTAIQNARTNATLDALGASGHLMCSDATHMQAGIAPLIASYTIAQKILKDVLGVRVPVNGCKWLPTDANTSVIMNPTKLTHETEVGATAENIIAAQAISAFAVNRPDEVTDCSALV